MIEISKLRNHVLDNQFFVPPSLGFSILNTGISIESVFFNSCQLLLHFSHFCKLVKPKVFLVEY